MTLSHAVGFQDPLYDYVHTLLGRSSGEAFVTCLQSLKMLYGIRWTPFHCILSPQLRFTPSSVTVISISEMVVPPPPASQRTQEASCFVKWEGNMFLVKETRSLQSVFCASGTAQQHMLQVELHELPS